MGPDGHKRVSRPPRDQWILIPGIHRGYITWEDYEENLCAGCRPMRRRADRIAGGVRRVKVRRCSKGSSSVGDVASG